MKKVMGIFAVVLCLSTIFIFSQNLTTVDEPNPYRLVVPDPNVESPTIWQYWTLSVGRIAEDIAAAIQNKKGESVGNKEYAMRKAFVDNAFGNLPGGLNMNAVRYDIGGDFNPTFRGTPGNAKPIDFWKPDKNGVRRIRDIKIDGRDYRVLIQTKNRGICDFGNDPDWAKLQAPGETEPKRLYCNQTLAKNMGVDKDNKKVEFTMRDIVPCYRPGPLGWGNPATGKFNPQSDSDSFTKVGNQHERGVLIAAVSNIKKSGQNPIVETESLVAPYFVMDSQCSTGRDFDFSSGADNAVPTNSITGPRVEAYANYLARVVDELNTDLRPYGTQISTVEPFNGPFGYLNKYADSRDISGSMVTWKYANAFRLLELLDEKLYRPEIKLTGFDNDNLGEIEENFAKSERADGGQGTLFALLTDRDTNNSDALNRMRYVSAHIPTGVLPKELSALVKSRGKSIVVTGAGCCNLPGAWDGPGRVVENRNSAPFSYPPSYEISGYYPPPSTNKADYAPTGVRSDNTWMGADKHAYVLREIIKYMGPVGWHFLSPKWGLFDVNDKAEVEILTPYYTTREYIRAIPPGAKIVPINDDSMVAATYTDASGRSYLSVIIYNGIYERSVPTQVPVRFPSSGRAPDSFIGDMTIKKEVLPLRTRLDLSRFNLDLNQGTTLTDLSPASSDIGGTSHCPLNNYIYLVQKDPDVRGKLYYGGCKVQTEFKSPIAIVAELPTRTIRPGPMKDWVYDPDTTGRVGFALEVPAHHIYFLKIPLKNTQPAQALAGFIEKDDAQIAISGSWAPKKETPFQYWSDKTRAKAVNSEIFPLKAANRTYTESKTIGAVLEVNFKNAKNPRLRIYGVQRPQGGLARVILDKNNTKNPGPQYLISTYGEYPTGDVLLFDTGELAPGTHQLKIFNYQGKNLSIDRILVNDPNVQVSFH